MRRGRIFPTRFKSPSGPVIYRHIGLTEWTGCFAGAQLGSGPRMVRIDRMVASLTLGNGICTRRRYA